MKNRVNIQRDVLSRQNIAQGKPEPEKVRKTETPASLKRDEQEKEPTGTVERTDSPASVETGSGTAEDKKPRGKAQGKP